jgi:hypothetical protein
MERNSTKQLGEIIARSVFDRFGAVWPGGLPLRTDLKAWHAAEYPVGGVFTLLPVVVLVDTT